MIAEMDGGGNAIAINSYDEYGIPGASNGGRFQYTGQTWLLELGVYYYKARMCSPYLGRFFQTDPIGLGGGMNIYAYVLNDPVNLPDPLGLRWRWHCVGGVDGHLRCGRHWVDDDHDGSDASLTSSGSNPGGNEDPGGSGGDLPCPTSAADGNERYLTPEDAGLAAAQAARVEQAQHHDNNERGFSLFRRNDGSYGFIGFTVGSDRIVQYGMTATGGGHIHTAGGGNRLSSHDDLGLIAMGHSGDGDREFIGQILDAIERRGESVNNTLSVLGQGDGHDVVVFRGRQLGGDGERIGPDQCR